MKENIIQLNDLNLQEEGIIQKIECENNIKRRLLDLGMIKGTTIKLTLISPFKDPKAYEVRGSTIAIRSEDPKKIDVIPKNN